MNQSSMRKKSKHVNDGVAVCTGNMCLEVKETSNTSAPKKSM